MQAITIIPMIIIMISSAYNCAQLRHDVAYTIAARSRSLKEANVLRENVIGFSRFELQLRDGHSPRHIGPTQAAKQFVIVNVAITADHLDLSTQK